VRRLTDDERIVLTPRGQPGEGPIPDDVFVECMRNGWGRWVADPDEGGEVWEVTPAGLRALELDTLARSEA
jgi:hypothetical protein